LSGRDRKDTGYSHVLLLAVFFTFGKEYDLALPPSLLSDSLVSLIASAQIQGRLRPMLDWNLREMGNFLEEDILIVLRPIPLSRSKK